MHSKWILLPKVKHKTVKVLKDNEWGNLDDLVYTDDLLDMAKEAWSVEEINHKSNFIKIKKRVLCGRHSQENKKTCHILGRKSLHNKYLIKDCYRKYPKNSLKLNSKNTNNQINKRTERIEQTPHQRNYTCDKHMLSENYRLKQWYTTLCLLEWPKYRTLIPPNAGFGTRALIHYWWEYRML